MIFFLYRPFSGEHSACEAQVYLITLLMAPVTLQVQCQRPAHTVRKQSAEIIICYQLHLCFHSMTSQNVCQANIVHMINLTIITCSSPDIYCIYILLWRPLVVEGSMTGVSLHLVNYIVLYYIISYKIVLCYIILHYLITLYYIISYNIVLLYYITLYYYITL